MAHDTVKVTALELVGGHCVLQSVPDGVDIDAELLRYDDLWDEAVSLAPTA